MKAEHDLASARVRLRELKAWKEAGRGSHSSTSRLNVNTLCDYAGLSQCCNDDNRLMLR